MTTMKKAPYLLLVLLGAVHSFAAPLSLENRELPGREPSRDLTFFHPTAGQVYVRHLASDWKTSHAMTRVNDDGLWSITVEQLGLLPGHHQFKFLPDKKWEPGANRYLYINQDGLIARPPAVYLTWQTDPATTMTIHWHGDDEAEASEVKYRKAGGDGAWQSSIGSSEPFPDTGRFIHTVELSGLEPDTAYEFEVQSRRHTFKTLPATLTRPVKFVSGGDVFQHQYLMNPMTEAAGRLDPDFVVIGGDLAYADGKPEHVWRWHVYFDSFYRHLRGADGRIIPHLVTIGNHETPSYYCQDAKDYAPGPEWQRKEAPYFYRLYAMPGLPGYNVLDIGDYASFFLLDTDHTAPITGAQTEWLAATLAARAHVPHLFPVYHVPAYPSVRELDGGRYTRIRETWVPLFEQAGITLAFEHHEHAFKITHPIRAGKVDPEGIVYIGDGAWGVDTRVPHVAEHTWYLRKTGKINHVFEITLEKDRRLIRAIDINGRELDAFEQIVPTNKWQNSDGFRNFQPFQKGLAHDH